MSTSDPLVYLPTSELDEDEWYEAVLTKPGETWFDADNEDWGSDDGA